MVFFVSPSFSCGHLYHASCLGLDTDDPGHLNHSCIVCHKTPAHLPGRGRTKTMAVSPPSSLPLSPLSLHISLCSHTTQGPHRGRSFKAQRSVSIYHLHYQYPSHTLSLSLSLLRVRYGSRLDWIQSRERSSGDSTCLSRATQILYVDL